SLTCDDTTLALHLSTFCLALREIRSVRPGTRRTPTADGQQRSKAGQASTLPRWRSAEFLANDRGAARKTALVRPIRSGGWMAATMRLRSRANAHASPAKPPADVRQRSGHLRFRQVYALVSRPVFSTRRQE